MENEMQSGSDSLFPRGTCEYKQLCEKLQRQKLLVKYKPGYRLNAAIQPQTLVTQLQAEMRRKNIENVYFNRQLSPDSIYIQLLALELSTVEEIISRYSDYQQVEAGMVLTRVSKPTWNDGIAEFLRTRVLPSLSKIKIASLLTAQFEEQRREQQMSFDQFFQQYIEKTIVNNIDLHQFIIFMHEVLDRIVEGDINFNSLLFIKGIPLFEFEPFINPAILAISFFYHYLLALTQVVNNSQTPLYPNISMLPKISFVNLDGFDHGGVNYLPFVDTSNLQYVSLFNDQFKLRNTIDFSSDGRYNEEQACRPTHSTVDTFKCSVEERQRLNQDQQLSNIARKHARNTSLFLPLLSPFLERKIGMQESEEEQKVNSINYREVFQSYVLPLVRKFQPDIIVISMQFSTNEGSHGNSSNLFIDETVFAEMVQKLQLCSNGRVIFIPRVIKAKVIPSNPLKTFDEIFYHNVQSKFAFQSTYQLQKAAPYMQKILGTFIQVQQNQLRVKSSRNSVPSISQEQIGNTSFRNRMNAFLKYLGEEMDMNPGALSLVPVHTEPKAYSELSKKVAIARLAVLKMQQQYLKEGKMEICTPEDSKEIIKGIIENPNHENFLHSSYLNIHIMFCSAKKQEKGLTFEAQRCYFQNNENKLLCQSQNSQYYVDYSNKRVFLFNISGTNGQFENYMFDIPQVYPHQNNGILTQSVRIPCVPSNLLETLEFTAASKELVLTEFSVTVFKSTQVFLVFGKISNLSTFSKEKFIISPFIFKLSIKELELGWRQIVIQKDPSPPSSFSPSLNVLERLYSSPIVVSKQKESEEPVMFIFGGILSATSGLADIATMVSRLVPNNGLENVWLHSTLRKTETSPNLRALCNSHVVEVEESRKILIIGGSQYKCVTPLNNPITSYWFEKRSDSSNANSIPQQSQSWKLSTRLQTRFDTTAVVQIADTQLFTNAGLSALNRNIFFSGQQTQFKLISPFIITLNEDKEKHNKMVIKRNRSLIPVDLPREIIGGWRDSSYYLQFQAEEQQPAPDPKQSKDASKQNKKQKQKQKLVSQVIEPPPPIVKIDVELEWHLKSNNQDSDFYKERESRQLAEFKRIINSNQAFEWMSSLEAKQKEKTKVDRNMQTNTTVGNQTTMNSDNQQMSFQYNKNNKFTLLFQNGQTQQESTFIQKYHTQPSNHEQIQQTKSRTNRELEQQIVKLNSDKSKNYFNEENPVQFESQIKQFQRRYNIITTFASSQQQSMFESEVYKNKEPVDYIGINHLAVITQLDQQTLQIRGSSFRDECKYLKVYQRTNEDTQSSVIILAAKVLGNPSFYLNKLIAVNPFDHNQQSHLKIKININKDSQKFYMKFPHGQLRQIQVEGDKIFILIKQGCEWIVLTSAITTNLLTAKEINFDFFRQFQNPVDDQSDSKIIEENSSLSIMSYSSQAIEMKFSVDKSDISFLDVLSVTKEAETSLHISYIFSNSINKNKLNSSVEDQNLRNSIGQSIIVQTSSHIFIIDCNLQHECEPGSKYQYTFNYRAIQKADVNKQQPRSLGAKQFETFSFFLNMYLGPNPVILSALLTASKKLHFIISTKLNEKPIIVGIWLSGLYLEQRGEIQSLTLSEEAIIEQSNPVIFSQITPPYQKDVLFNDPDQNKLENITRD